MWGGTQTSGIQWKKKYFSKEKYEGEGYRPPGYKETKNTVERT